MNSPTPACPTSFRPLGSATTSLADLAAANCAAHRGRGYQVELARDVVRALETPLGNSVMSQSGVVSSALVCMPTAAGKTVVAIAVGDTLQKEAGLRVGWVCAKRELLRQTREEVRRFGFATDMRFVSMFESNPPQVELLIWDEAHRDACMTAASLVAKMKPKYAIGLTATPWRSDGARLAYGHELRRCTIQSLQSDGYLAQYAHVAIDDWNPERVAQTWLDNRARFGVSVMFFRTAAESQRCLQQLKLGGARADLVEGGSDRESQLEAFADGELDVLVAMGCLTEGFSAPELRSVFVRPASKGPTIQQAGRVLRVHPENLTKIVVQSRQSSVPFTRIARPIEQWVLSGGHWRALGATRDLDAMVARMRGIVARGSADIPGYIERFRGSRSSAAVRGIRTNIDPMNEDRLAS